MEIRNHLLKGDNIKFVKSPTHSGEFKAGNLDSIVLHYTAGPSADSAIKTMTNPKVKASAHLIIGRDGSITQLVPFNIVAWHAGKSTYNSRTGYNNYSIGIELVNVGFLSKSGDTFRSVYGRTINPSDVIKATHRNQSAPKYWQTYTNEQIDAIEDVCRLLIDTYKIRQVLGHEEIAPKRKTDPGPAFPLDKIRERLLRGDKNADDDDVPEEGLVMVKKLNIRSSPNTGSEKVANPLLKGTKVEIVDEANGWYKVNVVSEVQGWVVGKYLEDD
jgi:N-acetylmuramoyl-L-alanine amidase